MKVSIVTVMFGFSLCIASAACDKIGREAAIDPAPASERSTWSGRPDSGVATEIAKLPGGNADVPANNLCSEWECDGKDPHATGCDVGAVRVGPELIIDIPWTFNHAVVRQVYSPACLTRWTKVESYNVGSDISTKVTIRRNYDGNISEMTHPPAPGDYLDSQMNWTDMLYCPRNTCSAESYAEVEGVGSVTIPYLE